MYNNDVGQESAQKFMKQTGDLKAATLYFAYVQLNYEHIAKKQFEMYIN